MLLTALLAAASLAHTPAPEMRVTIRDLDFDRADHVDLFIQRTRAASRGFCAEHLGLATPDRMGDPNVCRRGMAMLAVQALPEPQRAQLARSGQLRRLR